MRSERCETKRFQDYKLKYSNFLMLNILKHKHKNLKKKINSITVGHPPLIFVDFCIG